VRRTILLLADVLLCVVALGSDSPKEYDDKVKANELEGTWELSALECRGTNLSSSQLTLTVRDTTYTSSSNGISHSGYCHFDSSRTPATLDLILSSGKDKGKTQMRIYEVKGDMLKIASGGGLQYPHGFNDKDVVVWTYKRVK
jgi:uncharacterized protein (TIGR03067 family)